MVVVTVVNQVLLKILVREVAVCVAELKQLFLLLFDHGWMNHALDGRRDTAGRVVVVAGESRRVCAVLGRCFDSFHF